MTLKDKIQWLVSAKGERDKYMNVLPTEYHDKPEVTNKLLLKHRADHIRKALENSRVKFSGEEAVENHSHAENPDNTIHHFMLDIDHVAVHAKKHPNGHVLFKPVVTTYHGGKEGDESIQTRGEWNPNIEKELSRVNSNHTRKFS
ncbi:MAG: hypothetical protein KGH75_10985 [Rhodospirillales bacterium]|nr:hypothetical protein [Rhodospirillales bacterium]